MMNNPAKTVILLLAGILLLPPQTAEAQLGRLKKKLEKAVTKEQPEQAAAAEQQKQSANRPSQPNAAPQPAESKPEVEEEKTDLAPLVYDATFSPAIFYESLLDAVKINHRNGMLMLSAEMAASFLPTTEEGGATAYYGSKPEQHKLAVHILKGEHTLKRYLTNVMQRDNGELRSSIKGPFADFSIVSNGYAEQQGYDTDKLYFKEAGDYRLDFYLDDKLFYTFPFEVAIEGSDDPYAADDKIYALNGSWKDVAFIELRHPVDQDAFATIKKYTRVPAFNQPDLTYLVAAQLTRNGQPLLYGENLVTYGTKPTWTKQQLNLAKPWKDHNGTTAGEHLQVKDILKDGIYKLTLKYYTGESGMRGSAKKHIGPAQEQEEAYTFKVKDGKIQPQGNQVRAGTPPEQFIEGGRSHFWLIRKGATSF